MAVFPNKAKIVSHYEPCHHSQTQTFNTSVFYFNCILKVITFSSLYFIKYSGSLGKNLNQVYLGNNGNFILQTNSNYGDNELLLLSL